MQITKAFLLHIDEVTFLFEAYRAFYNMTPDQEKARLFIKDRIKNEDSVIFLAKTDDGTAVGFTQLYPLFSSTRMTKWWLLNDLFVLPEHRGQGISITLINAAKDLCRKTGAGGLSLETMKTNTIGNTLYPKTGFKLDEENNYYTWECE
ncbi:GNAT family N-acetyltransferase [Solitalea koreensis]|uniref:Predicted N-acetyltransferase YhbS n=1 Tax=Solitalea koreensis TaxID=543615 RepID=A0A521D1H1_9SPHI|nr:GNAT family N-acetyltransferase [Solitalea koreensis]SMO65518.1 Predicted N-acetyltransferase YhbS [Solitalea koreensis]